MALTPTAPVGLVPVTPDTRVTLTPDVQRLKPVPTQPRLLLAQASVKTLDLHLAPKTERPITTDVVRLSVLPDRPVPTEHARTPVSAAEAALVRDKPQVVRLLRLRLLLVKTVPVQHTTLAETRPVLSKARKTATVPASALPNAVVGVHLLTTVITEPAPVLINPVETDKSVPLPIPAAVVPHAPAQTENIGMIYAKPAVVRKADVKVTGDGVLKPTMAVV